MRFSEFVAAIFPYRTHLEREIDYLKAQLAQERRRVDVLTDKLKQPTIQRIAVPIERAPTKPFVPKGWDATRAEERRHAEAAPEVPAEPDAGSESGAEDSRATA